MCKEIAGYGHYLAKEAISLVAIFILLFVNSALSVFYFPVLAKECVAIDIVAIILWMILSMAMGEVFAEKRGDRIERILIYEENTTTLLFNMIIFSVFLLLFISVVIKSESQSAYFDLFLQTGHAIYFSLVLYIAYVILRPTTIEMDGYTVRIKPCLANRYTVSDKLVIPLFSIHFLIWPIVALLKKSPAKKSIEMSRDAISIVPLEKNFAGNKKPILLIMDKNTDKTKVRIMLETDKSLWLLADTLKEYLHLPEKA